MISGGWEIPYTRPQYPESLMDGGYGALLSAVLVLRGAGTAEAAERMLHCDASCLGEPMLMSGMAAARQRVLRAIDRGETVAVYGDYDVDGITSTCLVADYLRSKGLACLTYIPDRVEEGYGLNRAAIALLRDRGVTLVITVDCGITAVEEAEYAARLGMDMVITDHHECGGDVLPAAAAVIDYKQPGDNYPCKHLAGVGVALKLVCACEGDSDSVLDRYCDLAAIGTVADVMPLVEENRYLVQRGIEIISRAPRPGIAAMLREAGLEQGRLNSGAIGFSLAPRLNAAGRMGRASLAAELLLCREPERAAELAATLCELNRRRQSVENEIWQQASAMICEKPDAPIVLAGEDWHQGVIGIAASRLAEQFSVPAVMICLSGEQGKGSCRSHGGFNLYEALSACAGSLQSFGGHALAAGLTIRRDKIDEFRAAMAEYYRSNRPADGPELSCELLVEDTALLSVESVRRLSLLEPFGNCNPMPLLCMSGVMLESALAVGGGRHLKLRVRLGGESFDGIFFSHTAEQLGLREGQRVDVAFKPQINEFRGTVSVQLMVSGLRAHRCAEVCGRVLEGSREELWALVRYRPQRQDFIRVWRLLESAPPLPESAEGILTLCPGNMPEERFCLCLRAFFEAGLLESGAGGIYGAVCRPRAGKADLDATPVISALRGGE